MGNYAVIADVRALGLTVAEASDPTVEEDLTIAENLIDVITGDRFAAENALTFRLSGEGRRLALPRRIRAITSVKTWGNLLDATFYVAHTSLNAAGNDFNPAGDWDHLELGTGGLWPSGVWQGQPPVEVVGNFSWATTPKTIKLVCATMVYRRLRPSSIPDGVVAYETEGTRYELGGRFGDVKKPVGTGWSDLDRMLEKYVWSPVAI